MSYMGMPKSDSITDNREGYWEHVKITNEKLREIKRGVQENENYNKALKKEVISTQSEL